MTAPAYPTIVQRRCETCRQKVLYARFRGESIAYDLASHVYWITEPTPDDCTAEPMKLSLVPGTNGLGPAVPHARTCVDPRVPALDRASCLRVVPAAAAGPGELVCRCGARFLFATTRAGKKIPLDVESRVDWIRELELDGAKVLVSEPMGFNLAGGRGGLGPAVSHFRTCPKASEFSRGQAYTRAPRPQGDPR